MIESLLLQVTRGAPNLDFVDRHATEFVRVLCSPRSTSETHIPGTGAQYAPNVQTPHVIEGPCVNHALSTTPSVFTYRHETYTMDDSRGTRPPRTDGPHIWSMPDLYPETRIGYRTVRSSARFGTFFGRVLRGSALVPRPSEVRRSMYP